MAGMSTLPENPDLSWDLEDFSDIQRAMDFVLQFETTMCVYSASVQQLYTNYSMYFPEEWRRKLVILPAPNAFHDTFFHIEPEAVVATGLYVIPGELVGKSGFHLANVQEDRSLGARQVPFAPGLRTIMEQRPGNGPFLPVLAKGDLRSLDRTWPVLHLHRIKTDALRQFSALDCASLEGVIHEKLGALLLPRPRSGSA
jgi:hypothetical protein